jgi:hypothetical protein
MHHAPALALTLQPDCLWLGGIRSLGGSALCVASAWLGWHFIQTGTVSLTMLLLVALSCMPAAWLLRSTAPLGCELSWHPDDARWQLQLHSSNGAVSPPRSGRVECVADGAHWMLLRHTGGELPSVWLSVSRSRHPANWHALRCAVFSPGARTELAPTPNE